MIVESLVGFFCSMITALFNGFEIIGLPLQFINTLATITCYGAWVVGLDIISIFVATIVGWWAIKFIVGLAVFIWELLPLT